ncbi:conserved protein of unknown function [Magnetospirillum sp. XM-1]|uniref:type VII toxin-antitoxin system HepT family RNase toxin n=1 Tax=Magnetospirillum sp. XM-1 TaxID=1663591 RepID=UPI00073DDADF|nr:DUF86 domain-containing protein [Magnetospirillum sp. XM-1]CUW39972.1 conserved protein of unknown function [Magnetospirillum sp. XM-1]
MADDVLLNKAATIERCAARAAEEFAKDPATFATDFTLLAKAGWINDDLAEKLQRMVGFRNIAVHDYQALSLPITIAVIERHLGDFTTFSKAVLGRMGGAGKER